MKRARLLLFGLVALAQLAVPAWAVWNRQQTLSRGRVWKFRTAPIDPVDAMRGRYLALAFEAEKVPQAEERLRGSSACAYLKEDAAGFAQVDRLESGCARGDNVITVEVNGWRNGQQHFTFPFHRFWVNEKDAPQAERAYAANSQQQKENAYALVRVRDGDAALEQLYIDNHPLADYLRAHSAK